MTDQQNDNSYRSAREKFLGLSLESTRKSYYPQLQKQLEAARENERNLQLLFDNLPARIAYVNQEEQYQTVNLEYEKVFGVPCDDIVGKTVRELVGAENYERLHPYLARALAGEHVHFELDFLPPGKSMQWHEFSFVPVCKGGEGIDGIYVLARDLTEKKKAEEDREKLEARLRDAQKFEAIGTLAGGIAHDFNNLLMGIQGRASLMEMELEPSHPLLEHLKAIEEYIRSATDLTRQLLGFARGGKYEVVAVDLNELVNSSATMFGRTRKEVRIHRKLSPITLVVDVDRRQIEQVLLNMYVNAWQAMPTGGNLFLETSSVFIDEMTHIGEEIPHGHYARISVTDTGVGMDSDVRQRVFDPFFTTKAKQRGTGLGLASAYGIIKNHNGIITVYSEPGQGTTFNIYLPVSEKAPVYEVPPVARLERGRETVLLVDDENIILDVSKAMLEAIGYSVVTAGGGNEAIDIIGLQGDEIDLVLLDMIMPGMDGGRTFDEIRRLQPDLPVILSSGYSINGQADAIMKRGCNGFIQKPFNMSELSVQLRKILDQAV